MTYVRPLALGMGQAVAERTILRKDKKTGEFETWADVAKRVAVGNSLLAPEEDQLAEYDVLHRQIAKGVILMSGRHLQHGDENQPSRGMEVFTNCLHRDTKIVTLEHGPAAIGALTGKTVTVKARDGVWRAAEIKSYGTQSLYKITFGSATGHVSEHSPRAIVTANHRWFLKDGEITDALKIGDVLANPESKDEKDPEAVRHGLIFGDGSAHKTRRNNPDGWVSQGREYPAIRLCGEDKKFLPLFDGYSINYPPHAKGDPVVHIGRKHGWKDLPFTTDPAYIGGFIHGWWLADGSKTYDRPGIEISTSREDAIEWLKDYAAYAGYRVVGMTTHHRELAKHPGFANGKTLYTIRLTKETFVKVREITPWGEDEVFCVEEPVTTGFVLANGLLTGNCSTAATNFLSFYLLLNGSGVGRCYDTDMMLTDWDNAPALRCVLDSSHPDFNWEIHESKRDAEHKFGKGAGVVWFKVPDTREGWAKALEIWETMAYEKVHSGKMLILDFSKVRCKGSPIGGMQDRPSSGPVPLMGAFAKAATLKGSRLPRWLQNMYVDHYFAECVLVGGARRAARMSTMWWLDANILDFIRVKRPIEFKGLSVEQVTEYRKTNKPQPFLWSSNNSVIVDDEFWDLIQSGDTSKPNYAHALKVFNAVCECAYGDGTGEPGFINGHKLEQNLAGWGGLSSGDFVGSKKYQVEEDTQTYLARLAKRAKKKRSVMITNPCSEICLNLLGAFCVLADVVPFHADTLDEAEEGFRAATRALIRVNTMDSIYNGEVARTNRIGVGITGMHEFAFKFFGLGFRDLIDEEKSADFWATIRRFKHAVRDEAETYSKKMGMIIPHTNTTAKPAGTTSKLWGITEGMHLPAMLRYLRWVQFRNDDPLVEVYKRAGYPTRKLVTYSGTTIVGFPTENTITTLGMGDKMVLAGDATPAEQFAWIRMVEKHWIEGDDYNQYHDGNQISYTAKYKPSVVSYAEFRAMMLTHMSGVRCCSVMPQEDNSGYEYLPEQAVTKGEFDDICRQIDRDMAVVEDIGKEHIDCASGACPVDFSAGRKEATKLAEAAD